MQMFKYNFDLHIWNVHETGMILSYTKQNKNKGIKKIRELKLENRALIHTYMLCRSSKVKLRRRSTTRQDQLE